MMTTTMVRYICANCFILFLVVVAWKKVRLVSPLFSVPIFVGIVSPEEDQRFVTYSTILLFPFPLLFWQLYM